MSDGYMQPYQSLNCTAKLIRLPQKGNRSKSLGRSFWTRIFAEKNSAPQNPTSSTVVRSVSPSSTSRRSHDLSTTTSIRDDSFSSRSTLESTKNSRPTSRISISNTATPTARPRTSLSRSSISESLDSRNGSGTDIPKRNNSHKLKTTATVHLSKTNKNLSSPNLKELNHSNERLNNRWTTKHFVECQIRERSRSKSRSEDNLTDFNKSRRLVELHTQNHLARQQQSSNLELNSLQVFRQHKYRDRNKAEKKIKHLEHLEQNRDCNELVNALSSGMCPNTYVNQSHLNIVDFVNKEGFLTSSRRTTPIQKHSPKDLFVPPIPKRHSRTKEHIYAEINEDLLSNTQENNITRTPALRKKVTFSTFHEPIQETDPFSQNKKILAATFLGMVQVTLALRSKTDRERRRIVYLCHHAIQTRVEDNSLQFLGKVDTTRLGEAVFLVIEEKSFEICDAKGLVIVKHRFSDISVVTQIEDDACAVAYVGKCKFSGRVGVSLRFMKSKHTASLINTFRNRDARNS